MKNEHADRQVLTHPEIAALFGRDIDCACGRTHGIITEGMYYGPLGDIVQYMPKDKQRVLVLSDPTTRRVAADQVLEALRGAGFEATPLCLDREEELHADEWAVETTRQAAKDHQIILAVGAGTLGDIARYASFVLGIPFATCATAASMDGFVSSVSPLIQGGFKRTVEAQAPLFVFADPSILLAAPEKMASAGVGDMAGKLTAVLDWTLSHIIEGEYFCETTAELILQAAQRAIDAAEPFARGESSAATDLMDGLVLSGLAMQMVGNSRPASGCEHHVAHFWEMQDMQKGLPARLHGERVGVSTLLMLKMYQLFFDRLPEPKPEPPVDKVQGQRVYGPLWPEVQKEQQGAEYVPFAEEHRRLMGHLPVFRAKVDAATAQMDRVRDAIALLKGPVLPGDLGYTRDEVRTALLWACQVRQRMTVLRLMRRWGVLEEMVELLLDQEGL